MHTYARWLTHLWHEAWVCSQLRVLFGAAGEAVDALVHVAAHECDARVRRLGEVAQPRQQRRLFCDMNGGAPVVHNVVEEFRLSKVIH